MKKIAIIGLGSFGFNLVKTLAERNIEIIAIDNNTDRVNEVKDIATQAITMQATSKENLVSIGISEMDHVIVSTGPELEPSILIVHILNELKIKNIIAKALSEDHEKILRMVGASEVYFPERDIAVKIGNKLSFGNLLDYLPIESGYVIQEIAPPDSFVGKTLGEIDMRKKHNVTVMAIRSVIPESFQPNPGGDFMIKESDILIIFGSEEDIQKFSKKFSS